MGRKENDKIIVNATWGQVPSWDQAQFEISSIEEMTSPGKKDMIPYLRCPFCAQSGRGTVIGTGNL